MIDAFLYDAVRAPRTKGRPGGALSSLLPHELVGQLIAELRTRTTPGAVDEADALHLSCVGQVGAQGGNLALVSKLEARLPDSCATRTINNYCVGGISALASAVGSVASGQADLVLAGGVEMMSHVAFLGDEASLYTDPAVAQKFRWAPVGVAADHLAVREDIQRSELDAQAIESHRRARVAWDEGHYDRQVVSITTPDGLVSRDETVKDDLTPQQLSALEPVFAAMGIERYDRVISPDDVAIDHRHTIAHCPPIADGAAMLLVGSAAAGERHGLTPLAHIDAVAEAGGDAVHQLDAGDRAMERVLAQTGSRLGDIDVVEYMESFAAVPARFRRHHDVDPSRVNPNGGHLAMGHPMGATGAILITAVAHELNRTNGRRGLAVATGGSGTGAAVVLSR
ncbi:MAG: acetyl-CoA C-acyltransferase [Actinomycetota bacterium]